MRKTYTRKEQRAIGFTIQAFMKRIPMAVAPILGGLLIAQMGVLEGVRAGLAITLALAAATVFIIRTVNVAPLPGPRINIRGVWQSFHQALKRLLLSDVIIRVCEGLSDLFVILYVTHVLNVSAGQCGLLVAIQMTTSMLVYIPAGRIADRIGRKPFVIATFTCFALFPLFIVLSTGLMSLVGAFIVGGLREIGEPSRKALIVDFADPNFRARTVGLYYLVRSLSITPAAMIGGLLWNITPAAPFLVASAIGVAGVIVFVLTVEERYAA